MSDVCDVSRVSLLEILYGVASTCLLITRKALLLLYGSYVYVLGSSAEPQNERVTLERKSCHPVPSISLTGLNILYNKVQNLNQLGTHLKFPQYVITHHGD